MSKRGLSLEEKKVKMLEIMHDQKEFYTLKELEKIAPKLKGIVQQTVKDVLQDLVDDGNVQFDKIGTSNYYWSFPSAAGAARQTKLENQRRDLLVIESKIQFSQSALISARIGREECDARTALLSRLDQITSESNALKLELDQFGAVDPVKLEEKRKGISVAKDACRRWTDNTMLLYGMLAKDQDEAVMMGLREEIGMKDGFEDFE